MFQHSEGYKRPTLLEVILLAMDFSDTSDITDSIPDKPIMTKPKPNPPAPPVQRWLVCRRDAIPQFEPPRTVSVPCSFNPCSLTTQLSYVFATRVRWQFAKRKDCSTVTVSMLAALSSIGYDVLQRMMGVPLFSSGRTLARVLTGSRLSFIFRDWLLWWSNKSGFRCS